MIGTGIVLAVTGYLVIRHFPGDSWGNDFGFIALIVGAGLLAAGLR